MRGRLAVADSGLELTVSEAGLGQSTLQGRASARFDGPRPHITAELQAAVLDAAPLFAAVSSHEAAGPSPPAGGSPAGTSADAPGWLEAVDLDAVIAVREFVHTPIAIRDASLKLSVRDGRLSAPVDAVIADVPFHGELARDNQGEHPALKLTLAATNAGATKLAEGLTGIEGIRGRFHRIELHAATRATGMLDFRNGFDIGLNLTGARLSYGHVAGGRRVDLTLDDLALTIAAGKALAVIAHGTLLDDPFALEFTGGALEELLKQEAWPVDLSATGSGATLGINGSLAGARGQSPTRLDLDLSGERLGDLADWFGVSPCAAAPYAVRGQLILSANIGRLQFLQARLGETLVNGDLDWSADGQAPLLHAVLHLEALKPVDLDGLMPLVESGKGDVGTQGIAIDMPILPRRVEIMNADIELTMERLLLKPVVITDISLTSQIRGGRLLRSPFHAHIGGASVQGHLDTSGAATDVVFEFAGKDKDSGDSLKDLFSTAARWAGSAAVVPLQWLLEHELSARGADGCRNGNKRAPERPQ